MVRIFRNDTNEKISFGKSTKKSFREVRETPCGSITEILWREKNGVRYPIPFEVSIEVTNNCPFDCFICSSNSERVWGKSTLEDELSPCSLFNTIDEISWLGAKVISWSGGEPLLLQGSLVDLLKYTKKEKDGELDLY